MNVAQQTSAWLYPKFVEEIFSRTETTQLCHNEVFSVLTPEIHILVEQSKGKPIVNQFLYQRELFHFLDVFCRF